MGIVLTVVIAISIGKIDFMKLRYEKVMKSRAFSDPFVGINENFMKIDQNIKILQDSINNKITNSKNLAINLINKLDAISPLKTLTRGYCISEKNGNIVKSSKSLTKDDEITLIFEDGQKNAKIL